MATLIFWTTAEVLERLHAVENGMWLEWRGPNDDQQTHKLTANELAWLLRGFGIHPRTVWPPGSRHLRGKSSRGYYRRDFEAAWAAYCTPASTPPHRHTPALPQPTRPNKRLRRRHQKRNASHGRKRPRKMPRMSRSQPR